MALQIAQLHAKDAIDRIAAKPVFAQPKRWRSVASGCRTILPGPCCCPNENFLKRARECGTIWTCWPAVRCEPGADLPSVRVRYKGRDRRAFPIFFARVDRAGNITKRHSAAKLQFARFGAACPLWNVHQAFEMPGRIIRQLAEKNP